MKVQENVTVNRECDSPQGGVKGMKKVCTVMERCAGKLGRCKGLWGGVAAFKKCDSPQGGLKVV